MISENELLDVFDLDELDDTKHPCMIILFSSAVGYLRGLTDDLIAEGKKAEGKVWANGVPMVVAELTINEMLDVTHRWSCIKEIAPNQKMVLN